MKMKILLMISALVISSGSSNAQIKNDSASMKPAGTTSVTTNVNVYTNIINVSPLNIPFIGGDDVNWMHRIGLYTAIGGGLRFLSGFGVLIESRLYSDTSLLGFYIAPNIGYVYWKKQVGYGNNSAGISIPMYAFTAGILLGWQWVVAKHISLGLAIGIDDFFDLTAETAKYAGDFEKGGQLALRIHVGYIW